MLVNQIGAVQVIDGVAYAVGMWVKVVSGIFSLMEGYIKEIDFNEDSGAAKIRCFLEYPNKTVREQVQNRFCELLERPVVLEELKIEDQFLPASEVYPAEKAMDYLITGVGNLDTEQISAFLREAELKDVQLNESLSFAAFLHTLPSSVIPGLADELSNWIRHWGNGGGDCSTETCIRDVCESADKSATARELAQLVYDSVAEYSKSAQEANALVQEMFAESIGSLVMESDSVGIF